MSLLPYMTEVLAAVDRLRTAAGDQRVDTRVIRVGTVHAATSTLLVPAVRNFQERHPGTTVEVLTLQQAQIDEQARRGHPRPRPRQRARRGRRADRPRRDRPPARPAGGRAAGGPRAHRPPAGDDRRACAWSAS
ncbi:LysR substrate-binding domain-containing protein [Nocardioides convexus]|uniref:LysR substrate-binding domain-containing protein n=1 Tax=Nocardioides convexus TaxID=2712224 RepID=UPI0024183B0C|nr:LysR substrate-binding domain-containing protein [Nocardioides convexus]